MLVTGTDTGVGKTFVASGLAAALSRRGFRVGVMKPVETGCPERGGNLEPDDALRLKHYSGCRETLDTLCPYRFSAPRAPWVASLEAGSEIEISRLSQNYREILANHQITLVEGAGGLMVPIRAGFNFADLAREWNLSVLLVTTAKLGTLNHTLLSLTYLRQGGFKTCGYLINTHQPTPADLVESNQLALRRLAPEPRIGEVPYQEGLASNAASPDSLASLFESSLDWKALGKGLAMDLKSPARHGSNVA